MDPCARKSRVWNPAKPRGKRGSSDAEESAAGRRSDKRGSAAEPWQRGINSTALRGPLAAEPEVHSRQDKHRGQQKRNRRGGSILSGPAQSRHRGGAAIGQQQLRFGHAMRGRVWRGIERKLVTQSPREDTHTQQDEGWRQHTQTPAAAGQAITASDC
jgi:hypothetical protein